MMATPMMVTCCNGGSEEGAFARSEGHSVHVRLVWVSLLSVWAARLDGSHATQFLLLCRGREESNNRVLQQPAELGKQTSSM